MSSSFRRRWTCSLEGAETGGFAYSSVLLVSSSILSQVIFSMWLSRGKGHMEGRDWNLVSGVVGGVVLYKAGTCLGIEWALSLLPDIVSRNLFQRDNLSWISAHRCLELCATCYAHLQHSCQEIETPGRAWALSLVIIMCTPTFLYSPCILKLIYISDFCKICFAGTWLKSYALRQIFLPRDPRHQTLNPRNPEFYPQVWDTRNLPNR